MTKAPILWRAFGRLWYGLASPSNIIPATTLGSGPRQRLPRPDCQTQRSRPWALVQRCVPALHPDNAGPTRDRGVTPTPVTGACRGCGSLYWSVLGAQRARFPLCYLPCCLYPCAPRPLLLLGGRAGGSPLPLPFGSGRPPRRDPVAGPALGQRSRVTAGCKWCGPHKLRAAYECRCC